MTTKLCRPVLINTEQPVKIGSIMKYIKYSSFHDDDIDKPVGSLTLNKNHSVIKSNECWQHQQLILISLDPNEKIIKNDKYYSTIHKQIFKCVHNEQYFENEYKIITTQEQLSPEYIQQFVKEYNTNSVKDIEIEMQEEYSLRYYTPAGGIECCDKYNIYFKPKLINGFINIITNTKSQILYTEEEVNILFNRYNEFIAHHEPKYWQQWFEKNKKK